MSLQFILSEKGKPKMYLKGFLFFKDREKGEKVYWKCEMYKKSKCRCRVLTIGDAVIDEKQDHNHAGDAAHVEAAIVMNAIRNEAKNMPTSSQGVDESLISRALFGISEAAAAKLPSEKSICRTIRNLRKRSDPPPAIPDSRDIVVFSDIFQLTDNGEQFLIYDSGAANDRIVIFGTSRNLHLLARSSYWYVDGTFQTAPIPFSQVFTIHSVQSNDLIPLVYALLPDKSEQSYVRVLTQIKEMEPDSNPGTILTDFEVSVVNAMNEVFPNALCHGCFFHLCRIIYQKIKETGLKQWYDTEAAFALNMRMIPAVAMVPVTHVIPVFEHLSDNIMLPAEAQPVLDYFEDVWIGRPDRKLGRRPPKFNLNMWNCYENVRQGLAKTNTMIEGWHRVFEQQISPDKPNIWKFVRTIKKEQSSNEIRIKQYINGEQSQVGRKTYRDCTETLKRICDGFDPVNDMLDYLRDVACNISY